METSKIDVEIANYIFFLMEEKLGAQQARMEHSHKCGMFHA